jgi:hypothetical protein
VWFFRTIEDADGRWTCRRGLTHLDTHHTLHDALAHLRELALAEPPASVFAHWYDGRVQAVVRVTAPREVLDEPLGEAGGC